MMVPVFQVNPTFSYLFSCLHPILSSLFHFYNSKKLLIFGLDLEAGHGLNNALVGKFCAVVDHYWVSLFFLWLLSQKNYELYLNCMLIMLMTWGTYACWQKNSYHILQFTKALHYKTLIPKMSSPSPHTKKKNREKNLTKKLSPVIFIHLADVVLYDLLGSWMYNVGWQYQQSTPTVQCIVEEALARITKLERDHLGVVGAGRTDAGVHAWGQVCFHLCGSQECKSLVNIKLTLNNFACRWHTSSHLSTMTAWRAFTKH